jgi:hypothetical protein
MLLQCAGMVAQPNDMPRSRRVGTVGSMPTPVLVTNPRSDRELQGLAEALVRDGAATTAALASALRDRYPRVVVRERSLSHEAVAVWYVYREGSWIPSEQS